MYHSVGEPSKYLYNLSLNTFKRQMLFISTNYKCIRLKDVPNQLKISGRNDSRNPVAITFDDGYRNQYQSVHPVMEKLQIPYTVFIPTAFIGSHTAWEAEKVPYLSVQEIKAMIKSELVDIGSHSVSHRSLTRLSSSEIKKELTQSKKHLEDLISHSVDMFAYPYGTFRHYSKNIVQLLSETGYRLAVSACFNSFNRAGRELLLNRIFFLEEDSWDVMQEKLKGVYDWYYYAEFIDSLFSQLKNRSHV